MIRKFNFNIQRTHLVKHSVCSLLSFLKYFDSIDYSKTDYKKNKNKNIGLCKNNENTTKIITYTCFSFV